MKAALIEYYEKGIEILYIDGLKRYYFPILAGVIVDYQEQVFITSIKIVIQYSICQVLPKKQKNLTKAWEP